VPWAGDDTIATLVTVPLTLAEIGLLLLFTGTVTDTGAAPAGPATVATKGVSTMAVPAPSGMVTRSTKL